jgi:hypothetical protein
MDSLGMRLIGAYLLEKASPVFSELTSLSDAARGSGECL